MKVTLNIENDAELRAYIKDCIKGQVLAVLREDFASIIQNELERKIKGTDSRNFEYLQKEATIKAITSILYKDHEVSTWNNNFIKPYVENIVENSIRGKDWKKLVDDLAKEKVRTLLK